MTRPTGKQPDITRLVFLLILLLGASAARTSAASEASVSLFSQYSSNPFNLKDEHIQTFDLQRGANDRFDGLDTPWDVISRLELDAGHEWRTMRGPRVGLDASADYHLYHQNDVASFFELGARGSLRAGKNDRTTLRVKWIPNRYKRNYEHPDTAIDSYWGAEYAQYELQLAHRYRVAKEWRVGASLAHGGRSFDAPFESRDRNTFEGGVEVARRLSKHAWWTWASGFETANSATGLEEDVEVDRSFNQAVFSTQLDTRAGAWRAEFEVALRLRNYTTNNAEDVARFDRRDTRWGLSSKWSRRIGPRQQFHASVGYVSKSSSRPADIDDPDAVPYHRLVVGMGIGHQF